MIDEFVFFACMGTRPSRDIYKGSNQFDMCVSVLFKRAIVIYQIHSRSHSTSVLCMILAPPSFHAVVIGWRHAEGV
jgi:hypothetical protein